MKSFFISAAFFFACVPAVLGQSVVAGKVAETMDSGGYTYVRVSQGKDSVWVAAAKQAVKTGEEVSFTGMMMDDFYSKTQKRTFKKILFAEGVSKGGAGHAGKPSHGPAAAASLPVKVAKAEGKDAYTVGEVYAKRAELAGKTITVRGKVTKFNSEIMDRNWVHLQDGSGDPKAATHDLVVTTSEEAKVGETVTARGTLARDRDFGSGYSYTAILEKAGLKR